MKDENWIDMMKKLADIRLFSSLYIKKSRKNKLTSAQEVDALFKIAIAKEGIIPLELSEKMGTSKTIVSRLIENLTKKELTKKEYNQSDKRSYSLKITDKGVKELDNIYNYYLEPIYELKNNLGNEKFEELMATISKANKLIKQNKNIT